VTKDLPEISANSSSEQIEEYAERTFSTPEQIRARLQDGKQMAKGFAALQIEVKGRPWGVIVIDSVRQLGKDDTDKYTVIGSVLPPLLERVR
jgi:hypothetical protein